MAGNGGLGGGGKPRSAFRRHGIWKRHRFAGAAHACIEMQLGEAGPRIGLDHRHGLGHGAFRWQMFPRVWAKVVAAEDDPLLREGDAVGDAGDETGEIGGRHAGIAAVLIDLVAGRLNQQGGVFL